MIITSWQRDVETVTDFIFWGSKITADGDYSHEIKRRLLFGRKVMTNLDSIWKSKDITLPSKVRLVKAMVFPAAMCGCESWTVKKAECRKIDAFELWCWKRVLRVPWIARRSKQPILKEISSQYSLEGLMLKLKLQYFGHLMWRTDWCEERPWSWERLKAGGEGDYKGCNGWMASPTQWTWVWVNSGSWWWTGRPGVLQSMRSQRVGHNWVTELTELTDNDYTSGGDVSVVNLTGAARIQLKFPFVICREGSLQETWFSLTMVSSLLARVQAQFTSCL